MASFICKACGNSYSDKSLRWRCECGGAFDLDFQPRLDLAKITARKLDIWRYREALPLKDDSNIITLGEGCTPLMTINIEGRSVFIKQDHLCPTGSFKDRGATLLVSKIKELGIAELIEDSSGNAGASIAAYCAKAGIACTIFAPQATSADKLTQIKAYGANIRLIPGARNDAAREAMRAADEIFYASHCWNPYFHHGTKTFAYEICEQLGWQAPDTVVLPVGNGTLLLGAYIGFGELMQSKIIGNLPKIIAVQAENCSPLYQAFKEGTGEMTASVTKETIAEGIAIALPVRGTQIIEAVRQSGGDFVIVSEQEIKGALTGMCQAGFYIEPTAAATIAGVKKYLPAASVEEVIASIFTGHGLKAGGKIKALI